MIPIDAKNEIIHFSSSTFPKDIIPREVITSQSQMGTTGPPVVGMPMEHNPTENSQGLETVWDSWGCCALMMGMCNGAAIMGTSMPSPLNTLKLESL